MKYKQAILARIDSMGGNVVVEEVGDMGREVEDGFVLSLEIIEGFLPGVCVYVCVVWCARDEK